MYILISESSVLSLEDIENFKAFSIKNLNTEVNIVQALATIAQPAEDNHFWIDVDEVVKLSGMTTDSVWTFNFWNMLKSVQAYGYYDLEQRKVKAHVE